jgi:hypothetical protein
VRAGEALEARVRFVPAADAQAAPARDVDALVAAAQLVRAQIDAEEAAARGDFRAAHDVLTLFQSAVVTRGHGAVAEAAGKIAERLVDEDAYAASTAYRASMRKGAERDVTVLYQEAAVADLRAMGKARTTRAQDRMERSFGKGAPAGGAGEGAPRRARTLRKRSRW